MKPIYQRLAQVAYRLLRSFDQEGTETVIETVTQPSNPTLAPLVTRVTAEVPAVAFGVTGDMVNNDPDLVLGDLRVIVAAQDYTPAVSGIVKINGQDRIIRRVEPIPAAGSAIIYRFFVR